MPGYGLRRPLVSANREPKHGLSFGERKSIATDRVILVPGPPNEVQHVQDIYRMPIAEKHSAHSICPSSLFKTNRELCVPSREQHSKISLAARCTRVGCDCASRTVWRM